VCDLPLPLTNMKPLLLIVIILTTSSCINAAPPDASLEQFISRYKQAKTEIQKRTVCIDLIDADLLYEGANIDEIEQVFKNDFEDMGTDDRGNRIAIVHFVPPTRSTNQIASDISTGWFLSMSFQKNGTIVHYSLSNEGKQRSMILQIQKQKMSGIRNGESVLPAATNIGASTMNYDTNSQK
jgi:hypothetical protein